MANVDSLVSPKACEFIPSISLNTDTDAFLPAGLFLSGNLVSFRVFRNLIEIRQGTLWFLQSRGRQLHPQCGTHKPHSPSSAQ